MTPATLHILTVAAPSDTLCVCVCACLPASPAVEVSGSDTSKTLGAKGSTTMPPDYFSLGQLLDLAGTSYESVKATGATLSVSFIWTCFVDAARDCAPQLQVTVALLTRGAHSTPVGRTWRLRLRLPSLPSLSDCDERTPTTVLVAH